MIGSDGDGKSSAGGIGTSNTYGSSWVLDRSDSGSDSSSGGSSVLYDYFKGSLQSAYYQSLLHKDGR